MSGIRQDQDQDKDIMRIYGDSRNRAANVALLEKSANSRTAIDSRFRRRCFYLTSWIQPCAPQGYGATVLPGILMLRMRDLVLFPQTFTHVARMKYRSVQRPGTG
jgi:hypothetical protein